MKDRDLAAFLGLSPEEGEKVVPSLMPETRACYERMDEIEKAFARGETPPRVIACRPRQSARQ